MAHEENFDLQDHLNSMAAIFAIIGTIMAGMVASMMLLVIDGIIIAATESRTAGNDFSGHLERVLPLGLLTFVAIEFLTLRYYLQYRRRVRKDPNNRFEF